MPPLPGGYAWVAFVFTVALNLTFWAVIPSQVSRNESTDFSDFYDPVARSLVAGHGYPITGASSLSYPPAFSLLLAAVYQFASRTGVPEQWALSALTLVCLGASAVLVYLMARAIWDAPGALLAALAWSSYPLNLWLAKQLNSEVPFLVAYYGAVYFVLRATATGSHRAIWYLASGFLAGTAMLFRPIAIGLGFTLAVTVGVVGRRSRRAAFSALALLVGTGLAVLPWEAWVYSRTGKVILLSTNGPPSIADGLTYAVYGHYRVEQHPTPPGNVIRLMEQLEAEIRADPGSLESMAALGRRVSRTLMADPGATARLLFLKAIRAFYGTDSGHREMAVVAIQSVYLVVFASAAVLCWRLGGRERLFLVVILGQLFYFWGMTVLGLSIVRYLTPALGLLFLLIPSLLPWVARQTRRGAPSR